MYEIRAARKAAGLTQEGLAKRIGVGRATLSKYESGHIEPSISKLREIADALSCSLYDLFPHQIENMTICYADDSELEREQALLSFFNKLNGAGQDAAIERIEELALIPKYQRTEPLQGLEDDGGDTDTIKQEKPPNGLKKPNDGIRGNKHD